MTTRRIIAVLALAMTATNGWALGLGELDLQSALNERFKADISLYDADALEVSEIRVSLASADDFDRVGVERFFFLTTLRFEVVKGPRGEPVIKVTSSQAISEPYLNFIVEVLWPSGRMLREYTVLLDPPTFTQAAAPPVSAPSRTPPPEDRGSPGSGASAPSRTTASSRPPAARSASGPARPAASGDRSYGMTGRNDTAWKIAQDTLPASDVTVQQNMLAIKRLNPRAFIDDNVNKLKAGYVLRTPTAAQARELTPEQARQRVVLENEAWRSGRKLPTTVADAGPELKAQVDATRAPEPSSAPAAADTGQLRIVAEAGDSAQGNPEAEVGTEGGGALVDEERERLARELDELTYKMDRELENATSELAVKDRQLEVKNQEIADLQAQLNTMREEVQRLAAERAATPAPVPAAQKPWWQSTMALSGGALGLVALAVGGLFVARRRRTADEAAFYETPEAVEPAFAEDETALTAEAPADHWPDEVAAEEDYEPLETTELAFDEDLGEDDDTLAAAAPEAEPAQEADALGGETADVVGEAEIYIAYGRYPQAVTLLSGALAADPHRQDVRLKLLELYAETNDLDGFEAQYAELEAAGAEPEVLAAAEELRGRLQEEAIDLESLEGEPFDGEDTGEAVADAGSLSLDALDHETTSDSLDDEFSLDSLNDGLGIEELKTDSVPTVDLADADLSKLDEDEDSDFDLDLDSLTEVPAELTDGANQEDSGLDFELEFDDTPLDEAAGETSAADAADDATRMVTSSSASDQLGGDLGIDFDPDAADADGAAADEPTDGLSAAGFDDDLLDLDDILSDAPSDAVEDDATATEGAADDAGEEDFEFDVGEDSTSTKLDLARAYIDMGDQDGARDILKEVLTEGSESQQQEAQTLLETI
ncbi:MAG: FimV/HubP family polar landmark protein [Pseudomonadota bacterium]